MIPNLCGKSRKMFPISKKHKEFVHKRENHTAVDHTCDERSYRTNLEASCLKHISNTHTHTVIKLLQAGLKS